MIGCAASWNGCHRPDGTFGIGGSGRHPDVRPPFLHNEEPEVSSGSLLLFYSMVAQ